MTLLMSSQVSLFTRGQHCGLAQGRVRMEPTLCRQEIQLAGLVCGEGVPEPVPTTAGERLALALSATSRCLS